VLLPMSLRVRSPLLPALPALLALGLLAGCERPLPATPPSSAAAVSEPAAPRLTGIGRSEFAVTTRSADARALFHQGLLLAYAFDHAEARRAFAAAAQRDPDCAMCAWGLAYVAAPNINRPERDRLVAAREHIDRALRLAPQAAPHEQALIRALALRIGVDAPAAAPAPTAAPPAAMCATPTPRDADPADVAYAQALARAAFDFPDDADVGVLHAEALLMLSPWTWWSRDGVPTEGTREAIAELQRVLARTPDHSGALHFLIHAYEQSPVPQRALDAAARLPALVPDAGHLVHMPAHIYMRLGRYAEASDANRAAVAADARLAAQLRAQGAQPLSHPSHHLHFLWASAALQGDGEASIRAADDVAALAARHDEAFGGGNDYFLALPLFARVRFARWDEIDALTAAERGTPPSRVYPRAVAHWARGIAQARRGDPAAAAREHAALLALIDAPQLDDLSLKGVDDLRAFLQLAEAGLRGEIHAVRRQWPAALAALSEAVRREDALENEEPPPWALSTRVALARVQLAAGRAAQAERTLRDDLTRFPANGWALAGLADSLARQGRPREAEAIRAQLDAVWGSASRAPLQAWTR
jgi:tetratricopeptide (TPR) repeat protein